VLLTLLRVAFTIYYLCLLLFGDSANGRAGRMTQQHVGPERNKEENGEISVTRAYVRNGETTRWIPTAVTFINSFLSLCKKLNRNSEFQCDITLLPSFHYRRTESSDWYALFIGSSRFQNSAWIPWALTASYAPHLSSQENTGHPYILGHNWMVKRPFGWSTHKYSTPCDLYYWWCFKSSIRKLLKSKRKVSL
jgi:hypothetical protein